MAAPSTECTEADGALLPSTSLSSWCTSPREHRKTAWRALSQEHVAEKRRFCVAEHDFPGVCSDCWWGWLIIWVQTMVGLIMDAVMIGIIFARISHPKYRGRTIAISDSAIISRRDGILKFMFRIADFRRTQVLPCACTCHAHLERSPLSSPPHSSCLCMTWLPDQVQPYHVDIQAAGEWKCSTLKRHPCYLVHIPCPLVAPSTYTHGQSDPYRSENRLCDTGGRAKSQSLFVHMG